MVCCGAVFEVKHWKVAQVTLRSGVGRPQTEVGILAIGPSGPVYGGGWGSGFHPKFFLTLVVLFTEGHGVRLVMRILIHEAHLDSTSHTSLVVSHRGFHSGPEVTLLVYTSLSTHITPS